MVQPPPDAMAPAGPSTNIEISSRPSAGGSSQKEMLFMRGKAMSGAPIISGTNQLPKPPIMAGMTMKKIMSRPWRGDEHIVHVLAGIERGIRRRAVDHRGEAGEILDAGLGQFHAHDDREDAADHAGEDREPQIHRADVLVVGGVDVALPSGRKARDRRERLLRVPYVFASVP